MNRQKRLVSKELDRIRERSRRKELTNKFASNVLIGTLILLGLLCVISLIIG